MSGAALLPPIRRAAFLARVRLAGQGGSEEAMRIESALELQARIFATIFDFIELPATADIDQALPGLFLDPYLLETKSARVAAIDVWEIDCDQRRSMMACAGSCAMRYELG